MTKSEVKIWQNILRKKQLNGYKFLRQRPILNYIVDFFCEDLKLIIEIDGISHHHEDVYLKDVERQNNLEQLGYVVLRFSDEEISDDFDNVLRTLENWIELNNQ